MLRFTLHICPGINETGALAQSRQHGDNGRPLDALETAEAGDGQGQDSPGVAGTDDRSGVARFDMLKRDVQRRVAFVAHGRSRRVAHADRLGGVLDGQQRGFFGLDTFKLVQNTVSIADQQDLDAVLPGGGDRTLDDGTWGIVAAHGINCDIHRDGWEDRRLFDDSLGSNPD